jgi:GntR family transcriptional regulator, rspAB operon transcriptional repressor
MARLRPLVSPAPRLTAQQMYDDLHGKIVRGELRPGEPLSETKVAETYGMSRTPVREVFWRLGEDGFLRVVPQVGTYVAPISVAAVRDSQFIRETLECRAIADAARDPAPGAIMALNDIMQAQHATLQNGDFAGFFAQDEAFHRHLMTMSGRPFVWHVITGAKAQLDRVRFLSLEEPGWTGMILSEHSAIAERVAARDPAGASVIMQDHLRTAFAAIDRIAIEHAEFFEGAD